MLPQRRKYCRGLSITPIMSATGAAPVALWSATTAVVKKAEWSLSSSLLRGPAGSASRSDRLEVSGMRNRVGEAGDCLWLEMGTESGFRAVPTRRTSCVPRTGSEQGERPACSGSQPWCLVEPLDQPPREQ